MTCNCIDEMNATLAEHNTEVGVTFGFSRNGGPSYLLPHIHTSKIDKKKRVGPVLAIPTFCPFCGKSYHEENSTSDADPVEALRALLTRYVDLVNCGDCGFWNPETEEEVIAARAVLAKVKP